MFAAITAALNAVPQIVEGLSSIVISLAKLIDEYKTSNAMKKIELEQKEMQRSGNTKSLENRFRTGNWS